MTRLLKTALLPCLLASLSCASASESREAQLISVLTSADFALLEGRGPLVEGKYRRMGEDPYSFFRGSLAVFRNDWRESPTLSRSQFDLSEPLVWGVGDAHPENFGTLVASDGSVALEVNNLDAADKLPYLWDVRRLAIGMALAARISGKTSEEAQNIARLAALSYAEQIFRLSQSPERLPIQQPIHDHPILEDLFRRAERDWGAELEELTQVVDGRRTLRRGVPNPGEPTSQLSSLPAVALDSLPGLLRAAFGDRQWTVVDAVRELGAGVASWPRVRVTVLLELNGAPLLLEIKELSDSFVGGWKLPEVHAGDVLERVLTGRQAWSRPDADAIFGTASWLGIPVLIRANRAAHKSLRVSRMEGARGSVKALEALAGSLGTLLAGAHHAAAGPISQRIEAHRSEFADEQAVCASAYAAQVLQDAEIFQQAVARRGPRLGVPPAPAAVDGSSDWEAVWRGLP